MLRLLRQPSLNFSWVLANPKLSHLIKCRWFTSTLPMASEASPQLNGSASASPPSLEHPTSPQGSEVELIPLDFEFEEEPVGLTAEQQYGYLDVNFGEILGPPSQRYEIVKKPGFGMYSSVWLAKDLEYARQLHILELLFTHIDIQTRPLRRNQSSHWPCYADIS